MTDPLMTGLERIDAERNRLLSARFVVENAMRFRDQAVRLGFEPTTKADHTGFGMWVPFHDELVAALAVAGVVVPDSEKVSASVGPVQDPEDLNDAGRPWPAVRDHYDTGAPAEEQPRTPVAVGSVRNGWSPKEEADLVARVDRGESFAQIAKATNRKAAAVAGKYTYMRSRGLIPGSTEGETVALGNTNPQASPAEKANAPAPDATPAPAEPVTPIPDPVPVGVTAAEADPNEDDDSWTKGEELELLRLLVSGKSPRVTAEELGRTVDDILARRLLLNPSRHPRDLTRIYHERRMEAENKEGVSV